MQILMFDLSVNHVPCTIFLFPARITATCGYAYLYPHLSMLTYCALTMRPLDSKITKLKMQNALLLWPQMLISLKHWICPVLQQTEQHRCSIWLMHFSMTSSQNWIYDVSFSMPVCIHIWLMHFSMTSYCTCQCIFQWHHIAQELLTQLDLWHFI